MSLHTTDCCKVAPAETANAPAEYQRFQCIKPYIHPFLMVPFPCGKCLYCRKKRGREWSHRLALESLDWSSASFITLTYKEVHWKDDLEFFKKTRDFQYQDVQYFMKRLRTNLRRADLGKIKFFCVGEKGENNTHRVHWHIIIFGLAKTRETIDIVHKSWNGYGRIDFKPIINKCGMKKVAGYVSQYVLKKIGDKKESLMHCSQGLGLKACLRLFKDACLEAFKAFGSFCSLNFDGESLRLDKYLRRKMAQALNIEYQLVKNGIKNLRQYFLETEWLYQQFQHPDVYLDFSPSQLIRTAWRWRHSAKYRERMFQTNERKRLAARGSWDISSNEVIGFI